MVATVDTQLAPFEAIQEMQAILETVFAGFGPPEGPTMRGRIDSPARLIYNNHVIENFGAFEVPSRGRGRRRHIAGDRYRPVKGTARIRQIV